MNESDQDVLDDIVEAHAVELRTHLFVSPGPSRL